MLVFRGGDDYGVDLGVGDDAVVVAGGEVGVDLLAQDTRLFGVEVGYGKKTHRGMAGGHVGAEGANAAGTDYGDAQVLFLHGVNS